MKVTGLLFREGLKCTRAHCQIPFDPEDPSLAQLASLPWEFLYRKETRDFLNLSRYTPMLRYLDVQRPYTPLQLEPPLRILAIMAGPVDCPALDLSRERALVEASWATLPGGGGWSRRANRRCHRGRAAA